MRKIETSTIEKKVEYVFEEHELKVITECLYYCRHRHAEHADTGIQNAISLARIENLMREIGILK